MKKWILALTLASVSLQAGAETLRQAIEHTVRTNPTVQQAVRARQAQDMALQGSYGLLLPTISLRAGYGKEESNNATTRAAVGGTRSLTREEFGIVLRQLLFDGYGAISEVYRNRHTLLSRVYFVAADANDEAMRAAEAYLNVLRNAQLVRVSRENVSAHRTIGGLVEKRSDSGVSKQADVVQIKGRTALALADLRRSQGDEQEADVAYQRVVGHNPSHLSMPSFPDRLIPRDEEDAIHIALLNHPRLKSANADIDATIAQHQFAKSTFFPQIFLDAGIDRDQNIDGTIGRNHSNYLMVRAEWNLYRGGSDYARMRETAYLTEEARQVRDNTRRQVIESTRLSWIAYVINRKLMADNRRHMLSAKATVDAYEKQFKLNQRSLLDLLDQQNEYFTSRQRYLNSRFDFIIAKYRILNSLGVLVGAMDVPKLHAEEPRPHFEWVNRRFTGYHLIYPKSTLSHAPATLAQTGQGRTHLAGTTKTAKPSPYHKMVASWRNRKPTAAKQTVAKQAEPTAKATTKVATGRKSSDTTKAAS